MTTPYYRQLRTYVLDVARDLVARGIIRHRQGQPLEAIIHAEAKTVLAAIESDLAHLALDLGLPVVEQGVGALGRWFFHKVFSSGEKK